MSRARVIFLHGPAASGKFTIGGELAGITGLALFHNHLVVDLLLSLFPFGSPKFVEHRERLWLSLMGDAVEGGSSLIFTFTPERTVGPDFPGALSSRIAAAGGAVTFVELVCSEAEIERRVVAKSRRQYHKIDSLQQYRDLRRQGAFAYPRIESEFQLDTSTTEPSESAARIAATVGLPDVREKRQIT